MSILPVIKENYSFEILSEQEKGIIKTTQGSKRYRMWSDEKLLNWHQEWREKCSNIPFQLTDRMIQTKDGKKVLPLEEGWLTVHDVLDEQYPMKAKEQQWGEFLGRMIAFGDEKKEEWALVVKREFPASSNWKLWVSTTPLLDEKKRAIIQSCIQEAMRRKHKSLELSKQSKHDRLPIMDKISSTQQGKQIFDLFIWVGTEDLPERGFYSLTNFFQQWLEQNGEKSLLVLLSELDKQIDFRMEYGKDVLSEAWLPWELVQAMENFQQCETVEEIDAQFSLFEKEWNERRQLVLTLINWLKEDRKKVAT